MKQLLVTSGAGIGRRPHYHIVYLDDETGNYLVSVAENHNHTMSLEGYVPPTEPIMAQDEMGNPILDEQGNPVEQEPGDPGNPGTWMIHPGEDGHLHEELLEYEPKTPKAKKESDADKVSDVLTLAEEAFTLEYESMKKGQESDDYYIGKHWNLTEKKEMEDKARAALTFNKIQKHVNELSGIQRDERSDITYTPIEGGDQRTADLLNIVTKVELSGCNFQMEESAVFMDEIIPGRGVFVPRISYDESLSGKLIVERFPWDQVHFGPHEKVDGSDAEYVVLDKPFSRAKLESLHPDKIDEIAEDYEYYTQLQGQPHEEPPGDVYETSTNRKTPIVLGGTKLVDVAKKNYRVLEVRRKAYTKVPIIVNNTEGFVFNALGWKSKDLAAVKSLSEDFFVINKTLTKIRITKIAGNVVLSDENPAKLPVDDLLVIPCYGNFRNGNFWGIVEGAKDPQKLVNKLLSLAVDIVNKMAAYGYFYDDNTFPDEAEREKFLQNCNSPGFAAKLTDVGRPPEKVEGTKFPDELVNLVNQATMVLEELMALQVDSSGANESAQHLLTRAQMRLRGARHFFDNLFWAKKKLGKLLIPLIKMYRQPADIARIVMNQGAKEAVQLGGQPLEDFSEADIMALFEAADVENYDVEVTENPFSPTARIAVAMLIEGLIQAGASIPPEVPIEVADIPDTLRRKILDSLAAQSQAQAETAQMTSDMEIGKSLVAKGIIPPKIAEQQGIPHMASMPPAQPGFQGDGSVPPMEGGIAG